MLEHFLNLRMLKWINKIKCWNEIGVIFTPNGSRVKRYEQLLLENYVISLNSLQVQFDEKSKIKSRHEKYFALPSWSKTTSILRK